jgi:riboflavin synthase
MFTGLVRGVGEVTAVTPVDGAARLSVRADAVRDAIVPGASIAVDGVCLTVAEVTATGFVADVMPETLDRTTLGRHGPGRRVNLEPALRADDRLGGHIVQGHVDGVGRIRSRTRGTRWDGVEVELDPALARYVAEKGSVCVDGVSLTVTHVSDDGFGVSLIPTTLAETTLGDLAVGTPVNVEVDVLAKYVERLLAARPGGDPRG